MTAEIPAIQVNKKGSNTNTGRPGVAGKIAVVGAFKTEVTEPQLFLTADEAKEALGTDDTFDGCKVIDDLFIGASSLLAVNVATKSGTTWTKTVDATNLAAALAKIKGEDWDMLFVAATLTDSLIPVIDSYLDDTFEMKFPAGYGGCLNGANTAANVTSAGLAGDHCYFLLTQQLIVNGTTKSLLNSAAYYMGMLAAMQVGNTMTMKEVPGVNGVTPELGFETGQAGKAYVEAGITTVKPINRNDGRYVVVNSEQPNGLDLYINRVRDFVIKEMNMIQFLGDRNRTPTHNQILQECDRIEYKCVTTLDLLSDIEYNVEKTGPKTVDVNLSSLTFDDIITKININYTIEVQ